MVQSIDEIRRIGRARKALEDQHQEVMRRIDVLGRVYQQPKHTILHVKHAQEKEHRERARMLTDQLRP